MADGFHLAGVNGMYNERESFPIDCLLELNKVTVMKLTHVHSYMSSRPAKWHIL